MLVLVLLLVEAMAAGVIAVAAEEGVCGSGVTAATAAWFDSAWFAFVHMGGQKWFILLQLTL